MTEKLVLIAVLGGDTESLDVALAARPVRKVHLLFRESERELGHARAEMLGERGIEVRTSWIIGEPWRELAHLCGKIFDAEPDVELLLSCAPQDLHGPLMYAAMVHSIPVLIAEKRKMRSLPILTPPLRKSLGSAKLRILHALQDKKEITLGALAKEVRMSAPLLSHHLSGTQRAKGLVSQGLIDRKGRAKFSLTSAGRDLLYALSN